MKNISRIKILVLILIIFEAEKNRNKLLKITWQWLEMSFMIKIIFKSKQAHMKKIHFKIRRKSSKLQDKSSKESSKNLLMLHRMEKNNKK